LLIPPPLSTITAGILNTMRRIAVYIDGQNTYFALKAMGIKQTSQYNYAGLINYLIGEKSICYIGYYVGQLSRDRNDQRSQQLYEGQQRFLSHLKQSTPNLEVVLGKVMRVQKGKEDPIFYEKGVDVRLAIDMVHHAVLDNCDEVLLLSSDSDLLPAVKLLQQYKKPVHYIGFQKQKSFALLTECDVSRVLTIEECKKFESKN
jgi:uncharacterized LabA/DUF88 family protein